MSLPAAVEEAAARVKRVRLSVDGRSGSEDSSAEGSSGVPAAAASGGDAAAPASPQSEDRAGDAARGDSGGDSGSGGASGSDGRCPARGLRCPGACADGATACTRRARAAVRAAAHQKPGSAARGGICRSAPCCELGSRARRSSGRRVVLPALAGRGRPVHHARVGARPPGFAAARRRCVLHSRVHCWPTDASAWRCASPAPAPPDVACHRPRRAG